MYKSVVVTCLTEVSGTGVVVTSEDTRTTLGVNAEKVLVTRVKVPEMVQVYTVTVSTSIKVVYSVTGVTGVTDVTAAEEPDAEEPDDLDQIDDIDEDATIEECADVSDESSTVG